MNKESNPQVIFFQNKDDAFSHPSIKGKLIAIIPEGKHDDFGLKPVFDFFYFINGQEILKGWMKIGLVDSKESPHTFIKEKLKGNKFYKFKSAGFFSLQQEIQSYRSIVNNLGVPEAEEFLLAINDIVVNKKQKNKSGWFQQAIASKAFKNSLSRTSEAYFAYMNAESVLDGVEHEIIGKISEEFILRDYENVLGFKPRSDLPFEFNFRSMLPSRIVTLIGKNGVGKSQTLKSLVESLMNGDERTRDFDGQRPRFNRLLAIATAGEVYNTFPRPRKSSQIMYKLISHRRSQRTDKENGLAGLIVRLLRSHESIGEKRRIDLFKEAIQTVLPLNQISLLIADDENGEDVAVKRISIEPIALSDFDRTSESALLDLTGRVQMSLDPVFTRGDETFPLSSGQISFLRLAAQLCLHIENGSLVLLDEPETHFHPNLITDLMAFLTSILDLSGSVAILATHSAYVVREVPRSQVLVMSRINSEEVEVSRPRIKTLGAEIGEISFSIFGEQDFGYLVERIKDRVKRSKYLGGIDLQKLTEELPSEALMYLENDLNISLEVK